MGKFKEWITAQGGPKAVARLLDTESPTVNNWLKGKNGPKAVTMKKLVRFGKGAFDYADIINEVTSKASRK